jgi:hypothetical protein
VPGSRFSVNMIATITNQGRLIRDSRVVISSASSRG